MGRIQYNQGLLDLIIKRDAADLKCIYDNLTKRSKIQFTCSCGKDGEKLFNSIVTYYGLFCKDCINIVKQEKTKKTNMEKYDVEYASQSKELLEKMKQTNMEKYGVQFPCQNKDIMILVDIF